MSDEIHDVQVVLEDEKAILLEHEADGIKELDNQLPRWWVWLFYITILFSGIYLVYYHVADAGDLQQAKYERAMARASKALALREAALDPAGGAGAGAAAAPLEPTADEAVLAQGRTIFSAHCLACHLDQGQGLVGPNLTDNYWIHDGSFMGTLRIITEGVPAKGMISWKTMLNRDDIYAVACFIYTLRGTDPPNPKPPEGEEYNPAS